MHEQDLDVPISSRINSTVYVHKDNDNLQVVIGFDTIKKTTFS